MLEADCYLDALELSACSSLIHCNRCVPSIYSGARYTVRDGTNH